MYGTCACTVCTRACAVRVWEHPYDHLRVTRVSTAMDPTVFEGVVCNKLKDTMSGVHMQGYIPRLFSQSVTMQKTFLLSIFQNNLLCAKVSKFNYALCVI